MSTYTSPDGSILVKIPDDSTLELRTISLGSAAVTGRTVVLVEMYLDDNEEAKTEITLSGVPSLHAQDLIDFTIETLQLLKVRPEVKP